jgi:plastocyanin
LQKLDKNITLENGSATYSFDISSYNPGICSVIVGDGTDEIKLDFAVGLMPTGGYMSLNTDKNSYRPGDPVIILGTENSNTLIQLSLIDPNGISVESTQTVSDKTGHFSSLNFTIPTNAVSGIWQIGATRGVEHSQIQITINSALGSTSTVSIDKAPIALSPLEQFKSGVGMSDITCKEGLYLVVKSHNQDPMCLKAETISKLASRGFLYGTSVSNENYTTIIITPGSENQASHNTYSPDTATVIIGINNTVQWINQADVGNTIVSDIPTMQDGKPFDSDGVIKPGQSYVLTFTEPGTFTYHTEPHPWMKGTVIVLPHLNTDSHTSREDNTTLPASFMPCDSPYPQSNSGIVVLYMPVNSTGKICVQYSNSNPPQPTGLRIFEAHHIDDDTKDITSYATPDKIQTGNSTIVYTVKTTNRVGFYGLTIFCVGMPFAVGYDSTSTFVQGDFPWLGGTYYCPAQLYNYHIVGLSGIGVKYVPYP